MNVSVANQWKMKLRTPVLALSTLGFLGSCTKSFEGEYVDPNSVDMLTDKWNETDARKTAEEMVQGMLEKPWLSNFTRAENERPIVVVAEIENRTDEHIDTEQLTEHITNELINSGKVRFVSKKQRQQILDELKYQDSGQVAENRRAKSGRQVGAQFLLGGAITSNVQTQGRLKTVAYQITMTLTNVETAEMEWSERYPIKKKARTAAAKW